MPVNYVEVSWGASFSTKLWCDHHLVAFRTLTHIAEPPQDLRADAEACKQDEVRSTWADETRARRRRTRLPTSKVVHHIELLHVELLAYPGVIREVVHGEAHHFGIWPTQHIHVNTHAVCYSQLNNLLRLHLSRHKEQNYKHTNGNCISYHLVFHS